MKSIRAVVVIAVAMLQGGCGAAQTPPTENGFSFHDAKTQAMFVEALKKEGIGFRVRSDGMILYPSRDEEKVRNLRFSLLRQSFVPSYRFADESLEERFMERLKAEGIKFAVELKDGKRWITWSKDDDQRVEVIRKAILNSR